MNKLILFLFLLVLTSCGESSSGDETITIGEPEKIFQKAIIDGKEVKISTLASVPAGDEAVWYLQLVHQGRKLGECRIEVVDNSGGENIIGFSDDTNPDCDGVVIDPSSTSSNLILEIEDQGLEYCIVLSGQKTCQEISVK